MSSAHHFKDIRMIVFILQAKKERRRKLSRHLAVINDVAWFKIFVNFSCVECPTPNFFFFCLKTSLNLTLSLAFLQRLQAEEWTSYSVIIPIGVVPEFLYGELQGAIHLKGKESGDRQDLSWSFVYIMSTLSLVCFMLMKMMWLQMSPGNQFVGLAISPLSWHKLYSNFLLIYLSG